MYSPSSTFVSKRNLIFIDKVKLNDGKGVKYRDAKSDDPLSESTFKSEPINDQEFSSNESSLCSESIYIHLYSINVSN